ncbi:hypothetical protein [Streptomyces sp. NPDC046685]|uniref:hypothetical protein n=1 Tax=Streptomyces sp. NPDC046685 TaxID=3157202 RepID=UPI003409287F
MGEDEEPAGGCVLGELGPQLQLELRVLADGAVDEGSGDPAVGSFGAATQLLPSQTSDGEAVLA